MKNKKTIYQLLFAFTVTVFFSNKNFAQESITTCTAVPGFSHWHKFPYFDIDKDKIGGNTKINTHTVCTIVVPEGYSLSTGDCDDNNPTILGPKTWYLDNDKDGIGINNSTTNKSNCTDPSTTTKYVLTAGDPNDNNACISNVPQKTWYLDGDKDGYGTSTSSINCATDPSTPTTKYVLNNTDCNDANNLVNTSTAWYLDSDGDGFGAGAPSSPSCMPPAANYVTNNLDCDDSSIFIKGTITWYKDNDSDGLGDPNIATTNCIPPKGYVANNKDTNDNTNKVWYPNFYTVLTAAEVCPIGSNSSLEPGASMSITNNKLTVNFTAHISSVPSVSLYGKTVKGISMYPKMPSLLIGKIYTGAGGTTPYLYSLYLGENYIYISSNAEPKHTDYYFINQTIDLSNYTMWYRDADGDGYGNLNNYTVALTQPTGYVINPNDCDDTNAASYPVAWYLDNDGDGMGDPNNVVMMCSQPSKKYVSNANDCNDADASITIYSWYRDVDGDDFGDANATAVKACTQPEGYVLNNTDCDDADGSINPNTLWNLDNNNDGVIDDLDGTPIQQCQQPGAYYDFVADKNFHWIHAATFDAKGTVTSASRTYFNDLGKANVSLSRNYVQKRMWGTETTYDPFNRVNKTSFTAPSASSSFSKTNFFAETVFTTPETDKIIDTPVSSSQNVKTTASITASSAIAPNINVTYIAGNSVVLKPGFSVSGGSTATFRAYINTSGNIGSADKLTNYYSDANTIEPYQATAEQPYSQNIYDPLNPGNVLQVTGGNKINGEWKTGRSYTVPAAQEMYYVYGKDSYDGATASLGEEVITKFFKNVSVDANGVENVSFTDGEGKVLASARSGYKADGTLAPSYPVVSLIGPQGFVDVHIPAGIASNQISLINNSGVANAIKIFNLKTGQESATIVAGNAYRLQIDTTKVKIPTISPKTYITAGGGIDYDKTFTDSKNIQNSIFGIRYSVNYYEFAVNVYNKTGQLTKSIQPNGYKPSTIVLPVPQHMASTYTTFTSTFTYNGLGQLIKTTSPDEGTAQFAYRKDGQIRYSQSALQVDNLQPSNSKVSYTDYDTYGRPIESGVITGTTAIWDNKFLKEFDNNTSLIAGTRTEQTFTIYDEATDGALGTLTLPNVLTTAGVAAIDYAQKNLSGNVAITYTKPDATGINAITWYNYDIYGRVTWLVQYNQGLGAKTIHYLYDHRGNVKQVLFQKDKAAERFVHQYTYDANDVLQKVATSTDNVTFTTQAEYSYYATGELKRVNMAQGTQGLDYVYTLGGALKSINHPSLEKGKDPGGDANDVFGLTLDYYAGDYLRTGSNISTSPSIAFTPDYNGNIKAARFANKEADFKSGTTAQQKAYSYTYDRNNWLTHAQFGTVNNDVITNSTNYLEGGIIYDPNGNIKTLQRTNETGAMQDNLAYNYNTDKNNNQLTSVTDAVASTVSLNDIDSQVAGNYTYDNIGQLTRNEQDNINYVYNTQGLVTEINRGKVNPKPAVVKFFYNERGQRIKKESYRSQAPYDLLYTDYYVLDLSGNVMAIYNKLGTTGAIAQQELPIFGTGRLGVYKRKDGSCSYQITDHLGNVRAVVQKGNSQPISVTDYYPFGEQLPSRTNGNDLYRYAFQGQELDKETGMEAFQLRLWDGRIGRWLSTDPYGQYASPYLGMGNNPINGIDPDGGLWKEGNNGQIVAEDGDNAATLATYMKIDIKEAAKILAANGVKTNNGILDLKIGQEIAPIVVFGGGKKKGSTSFNNFRSNLINISFDKNADNPVNPKLTNYLSEVIKKASKQGIFSINVSSTTNHSSNSKNSAHSFSNGARALDINYINGVHVSPNDRNSKILQKIIQSTPGWRENYGPSIIQKMNNGTPILAPWARDIKGGHFDHVHISVPK